MITITMVIDYDHLKDVQLNYICERCGCDTEVTPIKMKEGLPVCDNSNCINEGDEMSIYAVYVVHQESEA